MKRPSRRTLAGGLILAGLAWLAGRAWFTPPYAHANLAPPFTPVEVTSIPGSFEQRGVVQFDPSMAHPGYNLFDPLHDTRVHLLDMMGRIVHTWSYIEAQPGGPPPRLRSGRRWMALDVLPDGSLILIRDRELVMRLSWYSELIGWHEIPAHHDIAVDGGGAFSVWADDLREYRGQPVLFSRLHFLAPDLRPLGVGASSADLVAQFPNPQAEALLARGGRTRPVDYYHENAVSVIGPSALPAGGPWTPGNLLVCLRNVGRVLVLDAKTQGVLWEWGNGVLDGPHHPRLLPNGHILVFDNGAQRGWSRVLELDPMRSEIVWHYPLRHSGRALYSEFAGAAQRLANGNTLITESDEGRVIEVTPTGETVWEFLHPAGLRPTRSDWHRARLYRMLRISDEWLDVRLASGEGRPGPHPVWWE